jgi:hypothetical protein
MLLRAPVRLLTMIRRLKLFNNYDMLCRAVLLASRQTIKSENPFANLFPWGSLPDSFGFDAGVTAKSYCRYRHPLWRTGTRVLLDYAPGAVVHTFDVTPWDRFDTTYLTSKDFVENGGRLTQYIADSE